MRCDANRGRRVLLYVGTVFVGVKRKDDQLLIPAGIDLKYSIFPRFLKALFECLLYNPLSSAMELLRLRHATTYLST